MAKMAFFFPIVSIIFCMSISTCRLQAHSNIDVESLLAFKNMIDYAPNGVLSDWRADSLSACNWTGVTCSALHAGRVEKVQLRRSQLCGTIAPQLGNLTFLRILDLSENFLQGSIPSSIRHLHNLQKLDLNKNSLHGAIPSICNTSSLLDLDVSRNFFSDSIPLSLLNCTALRSLGLSHNRFSGTIPAEMGRSLSKLRALIMKDNRLEGNIPKSLCSFSNLEALSFSDNQLTGTLEALYNCSRLQILGLSYNILGGVLPSNIGNLWKQMELLHLSGNEIEGTIPESIGNISLVEISLSSNRLRGSIPQEFSLLNKTLFSLDLGNNRLSGTALNTISKFKNLKYPNLTGNAFSGYIMPDLAQYPPLVSLDLSWNNFSGSLSIEHDLNMLEYITLSHNRFSGPIPNSFEKLSSLQSVDLSHNRFSGPIPSSFAKLDGLESVDLSHNRFSGPIPNSFAKLDGLQSVDLSYNRFSGPITNSFAKLYGLQSVNLSHNRFSGPITNSFAELDGLQSVDLSYNRFSGPIPEWVISLPYLNGTDLSHNNLTGPLPKWLLHDYGGNFLDISYNDLEGMFHCINKSARLSFLGNPRLCDSCMSYRVFPCSTQLGNSNENSFKNTFIPVIIFIGIVVLCCAGILTYWLLAKNSKKRIPEQNFREMMVVSEEELRIATNMFNPYNLLGEGSYATVFLGILRGGQIVAVKLFQDLDMEISRRSFLRECETLGKIRHRNLVRIITACSTVDFNALVLEFMPNGSLDRLLHMRSHDGRLMPMNLQARLRLLRDVTSAISYLHNDCVPPIVHCDIKPLNILFDSDMTARLSDFGLARILRDSNSHCNAESSTLKLKGSIGYIAPEYGVGSNASEKGDVYSYGITLLEVLTRFRPTDSMLIPHQGLRGWVSTVASTRQGILEAILKTERQELIDSENEDEVAIFESLLMLGLSCTSDAPETRPTIHQVGMILSKLSGDIIDMRNRSIEDLLEDSHANVQTDTISYSSTFE